MLNTCTHDACGFQSAYPMPVNAFEFEANLVEWKEQNGRLVNSEERGLTADLYEDLSAM